MHETALENAFICQPQQRNMYGRIFGGFLMRCAVGVYGVCFWWCVRCVYVDNTHQHKIRSRQYNHISAPLHITNTRRAYELAWATGFQFLGTRPVFVEVDEITFKRPVDVGDLLRLRSRVLWAAPKSTDPTQAVVHVQVVASVSQPEFVKSDITNTFVFVFEVDVLQLSRGVYVCASRGGGDGAVSQSPAHTPAGLKRILPATAEEASLLASFHPW